MTELERASAEQNLSSKIRLGVKGGDSCIMTPQPLTFRKLKKTESVPWSCGCQGAAGLRTGVGVLHELLPKHGAF